MISVYGLLYAAPESFLIQVCTNFELAYTYKKCQQFDVTWENELS